MHVVKLVPEATKFLSDYGNVMEWITTLFDAIYMELDDDHRQQLRDIFYNEVQPTLTCPPRIFFI